MILGMVVVDGLVVSCLAMLELALVEIVISVVSLWIKTEVNGNNLVVGVIN